MGLSMMQPMRICHDEDQDSSVEVPCGCRDSLKYAHRKCDPKIGFRCLYVKVSMDGAPYLRKVELEIYHSSYLYLSSALEKNV
ncbi:putative transcription regulator AUX/IAA family [Helianthus debilis subsp. tardiflorus]